MAAAETPPSPLEEAAQAKQDRDLPGEIGALVDGERSLTEAPWYPPRPDDLVTIHYEPTGSMPRYTESYRVTCGALSGTLALVLAATTPDEPEVRGMCGFYETGADLPGGLLLDVWMEAGPARLVIERGGERVHDGPAAAQ